MKKKNIREKTYNFDSNKELCIYKNLCESKEPKKLVLKKIDNCNFNTYSQWNAYVRKKYEVAPLQGLKEFKRYLNNRRRLAGTINNWWNLFLLPFFTTFLCTFIVDSLKEMPIFNLTNLDETLQMIPRINIIIYQVLIILLILIMILLASSPAIIIFISLFVFMRSLLKTSMENELEKVFYSDYIEIINVLIKEKETLGAVEKDDLER
ncbi:MAG: hypothetical protein PHV18_05205 [Lachnospiraceae bacterium]|nr:hypothetical protein [Lachnospiraceae bacterium]